MRFRILGFPPLGLRLVGLGFEFVGLGLEFDIHGIEDLRVLISEGKGLQFGM